MDFMRKVILALSAVFALTVANAQSGKNQVGIGAEVALPMGAFGDAYGIGFGGGAKYLHGIGEAGQVTLSASYLTFSGKDFFDGYKTSFIPVLVGYRHNFNGFYAEPQVGYTLMSTSLEDESESTGGFGYAVGVGYAMESGFDISARYQAVSKGGTSGWIGARVAYNFSIGGGSAKK